MSSHIIGGGGGGEVTLHEEVVLGSPASSISSASIPDTHKDLLIIAELKTDRSDAASDSPLLQLGNGTVDSGASDYAWSHTWVGTSPGTQNDGTSAHLKLGICAASLTATPEADVFTSVRINVLGYTDTAHYRPVQWQLDTYLPVLDQRFTGHGGGTWVNAADILDIATFTPETGTNFVAGSVMRVYLVGEN